MSLADLIRRPTCGFDEAIALAEGVAHGVSRETLEATLGVAQAAAVISQVQTSIKYAGYVERQDAAVRRVAADAAVRIPDGLEYSALHALSFEVRQVLASHRPSTLGAAARLPGVTPAAIAALRVHLKKARGVGPPVADAA